MKNVKEIIELNNYIQKTDVYKIIEQFIEVFKKIMELEEKKGEEDKKIFYYSKLNLYLEKIRTFKEFYELKEVLTEKEELDLANINIFLKNLVE